MLKTLDDNGMADNTIVIYTSDHGEMMGSRGHMAKQMPHEESCRVPFFIRHPMVE
jgi:arylsulfatase A-like enzyme